jgi:flagellar hook protein FlgE
MQRWVSDLAEAPNYSAEVRIDPLKGFTASDSAAVTNYINTLDWGNGRAVENTGTDPTIPLEYYWSGTIAGETSIIIPPVTTSTSAVPKLVADPVSFGNNATEYYWADMTNPTTTATTPGTPTPLPLPDYPDPLPIPPVTPTSPQGTWSAQMETVTRSDKYFANGLDGLSEVQAVSTTTLGDNFYEHNGKKQDGYTYGDLRYVSVATDGVLSAAYSNGVTLQLYQIVLYEFPSKQNLRREGGNLFTQTRESGDPSSGAAGTGTFGTTQSNTLEQSNVDLAREFVNMITTQRGFQANSKSITTVDTMLETVINMKR